MADLLTILRIKWRILRNMANSAGNTTYLYIDENAGDNGWSVGSADWTLVGQIVDKIENETSIQFAKWSLLNEFWTKKVPVEGDAGKLKWQVALDAGDATNQLLVAITEDHSLCAFALQYGNSMEYDVVLGYIASHSRMVAKKELMVRDIEVELTGEPGYAAGSGDLSA